MLDTRNHYIELSLWELYDDVCAVAERISTIGIAMGFTDGSDQALIIAEIMKMGDIGDGLFLIPQDNLPAVRSAGLIRIVFDWDATQMRIVPEFYFSLQPLDI